MNRGPHVRIEQIGDEVNLPVSNRDDIRWDVGRHVASLSFNHR